MPEIWKQGADCLFLDSDEATKEQLSFIAKVKNYQDLKSAGLNNQSNSGSNLYEFRTHEEVIPSFRFGF
jgi:exodeoxyribonuclease V alpha subunit